MSSLSRGRIWLIGLITLCAVIELVLTLSDMGIGPVRLRRQVYDFGGFWPGLLQDWTPNFPLQPYAMFASYGFLHAGFAHMAMNMVTLWALGTLVLGRVGLRGFGLVYGVSLLGGAVGYGLLAPGLSPMVGASGALFGLAGAVLAWTYVDRFTAQQTLWPVAQIALLLVAMNLVMWWSTGGNLAWQTHLGGFITGWIIAVLVDPRPRVARS